MSTTFIHEPKMADVEDQNIMAEAMESSAEEILVDVDKVSLEEFEGVRVVTGSEEGRDAFPDIPVANQRQSRHKPPPLPPRILDEFDAALSHEDEEGYIQEAKKEDSRNTESNQADTNRTKMLRHKLLRYIDTFREYDGPLKSADTFREYVFAICAGVLLSFNSGYVNGSCYSGLVAPSGKQQTVTSYTGTTTDSALDLADGDIQHFGFLISLLLSFALGSFIAGILTPDAAPFRIMSTYGPTFLIGACFLTISSVLAALGSNENFMFYLAAAANGLQNGISSIYSRSLIRSTALSGATTDIGIFIGQCLRGNRANLWRLVVLLCLVASFWTGSFVSFYATSKLLHFSLLVNAGLYSLIGGCLIAFLTFELHISLVAAVFGTWQWKNAMPKLQATFTENFGGVDDVMLSDEHLDKIFDMVDEDHSGDIDFRELRLALRKANIIVSKRWVSSMMKRADTDRNGTISRSEWHAMAMSCHAVHSSRSTNQKS